MSAVDFYWFYLYDCLWVDSYILCMNESTSSPSCFLCVAGVAEYRCCQYTKCGVQSEWRAARGWDWRTRFDQALCWTWVSVAPCVGGNTKLGYVSSDRLARVMHWIVSDRHPCIILSPCKPRLVYMSLYFFCASDNLKILHINRKIVLASIQVGLQSRQRHWYAILAHFICVILCFPKLSYFVPFCLS